MKKLILATGMLLLSAFSANAALIAHSVEADITETNQRFSFDFTDLSQFEDGKDAYLTFIFKGDYGRLNAKSATLSIEYVHGSARVGTSGEQLNMIDGFEYIDYFDTASLGLTGSENIVASYKLSADVMARLKSRDFLRAKVANAYKVVGSDITPLSEDEREFVRVVMSSEPTASVALSESSSLFILALGLCAFASRNVWRKK
ncbi:hypothetical protein [Alteromonas confluentis]|uniref:PEP-CTERM protein-sorting domain-containing protein n=1 Tax=Alteromonas confluentis TaxID=1656094 RepID=A0A1E7ZF68_9ALTE|nr:hypothetical protein [Alteromonas confluentis]OFC72149.1 hypothetical protein BFC18_05470 [Alteromonas confluentis]